MNKNRVIFQQSFEELFEQAISLEPKARLIFLKECQDRDPTLAAQVSSMIRAHDEAGDFLEKEIWEMLFDLHDQSKANRNLHPERIGSFRILDILGEGGMGTVYLAYQSDPVKRKVALKVIKDGYGSPEMKARFKNEYKALARLSHGNLAHIFDVGSAENRPFFTMEYFPGLSIVDFCRQQKMGIIDRISLMLQVCDGVQHIHQKGIIHRDLKPSNILVRSQSGKPTSKIIDFGVAKAISGLPLGDLTHLTGVGTIIGTLAYISPEQTKGNSGDADTRTDVYGLGAILYELLTGYPPHDVLHLRQLPIDQAFRFIRENEPCLPSVRVRENSTEIIDGQLPNPRWAKLLNGELDWVLAKSLAIEKAQRYKSANEFALDLERFLLQEPVTAHPPSRFYAFRKFLQRHRAGAGISIFLIITLIFSSTMVLRSFLQTKAANRKLEIAIDEKRVESQKYQALYTYMKRIVSAPNPYIKDKDVKVVDVLIEMEGTIDKEFIKYPEVQIALHRSIGYTYANLGYPEKAENHFVRAYTLTEINPLKFLSTRMRILYELAEYYYLNGQLQESENALQKFQDNLQFSSLKDDPLSLRAERIAAHLHWKNKRLNEAVESYKLLRDKQVEVFPPHHLEVIDTLRGLANALRELGRLEESIQTHNDILAIHQKIYDSDHPEVLITLNNLANAYADQGKYTIAADYHRDIFEKRKAQLGEKHLSTIHSRHNLAWVLYLKESFDEALAVVGEAIELYISVIGEKNLYCLNAFHTQANILNSMGRHDDAIIQYQRILALYKQSGIKNEKLYLKYQVDLAKAYIDSTNYDVAGSLLTAVMEKQINLFGSSHPSILETQFHIGLNHLGRGTYESAVNAFRQTYLSGQQIGVNIEDQSRYQGFLGYSLIKIGEVKDGLNWLEKSINNIPDYSSPLRKQLEAMLASVDVRQSQ